MMPANIRQILVVDDEPDIVLYLKQLLEDDGFPTLTAFSGKDALKTVKNESVDILITDIRMPEMDGIELINKILNMEKKIQIIILTGHSDIDTAIEAMKKGALNYLRKPVNFEELLITIRKGLAITELQENLEIKTDKLIESNKEVKKALSEVKQLSSFLPICASCKKIRDDKGYWNQIEAYISTHTNALFSHGICPECSEKLYGDVVWFP
jgi:DNA-binding NtrC family response regulator